MSGNSTKRVENLLVAQFSATHVRALLTHYVSAIEKFVAADWEGTAQKAGKFIEATTKALALHCGNTLPKPRAFSAGQELRKLEHATAYPDSIRLVIPRAAIFAYDIVSNRGGRHDSHDVDANEMDATAIVPLMSWILAEMVRLGSSGDTAAAMNVIRELTEKKYPYFEDIDGRPYINFDGNPGDTALLILYSIYPERMRRKDLVDMVARHGHSSSSAASAVHRLKRVVDDNGSEWLLRGNGRELAEKLLQKIATSS